MLDGSLESSSAASVAVKLTGGGSSEVIVELALEPSAFELALEPSAFELEAVALLADSMSKPMAYARAYAR